MWETVSKSKRICMILLSGLIYEMSRHDLKYTACITSAKKFTPQICNKRLQKKNDL